MAQTILIWIIIALCAFYIGRRFYRQWHSALGGSQIDGCDGAGCGCCSTASNCSDINKIKTIKTND